MAKQKTTEPTQMTHEEFVRKAIVTLRIKDYKGIHTVYSGFNAAFRRYYGDQADPVSALNQLKTEGKLHVRPSKGGAFITLPEDKPSRKGTSDAAGKAALDKILG